MLFTEVGQNAILRGGLDKCNVYGVPAYTGPLDDYIDMEITFNADNYELVYSTPDKPDVLKALHHGLLMFGVNPLSPNTGRVYNWPKLQEQYMKLLYDEADGHPTAPDAVASLLLIARSSPVGFKCSKHQWLTNYDAQCAFCCASLLIDQIREASPCVDALDDNDISTEWDLTYAAQLTAFIHYIYTLVPAPFVICTHDECMRKFGINLNPDTYGIIAQEIGFYSTRHCGTLAAMSILEYLHSINCPLTASVRTTSDVMCTRTVRAFDFGLATRVLTFLIKTLNRDYLVELKTIVPGTETRRAYQRLVIRMPICSITTNFVERLYKLFPTIMINYGILGFDFHQCTDDDSTYEDLLMPEIYKITPPAFKHLESLVDSPIMIVKDMTAQQSSNVIEIAHQIMVDHVPKLHHITADYINVLIRALQLGIANTFEFSHVHFPALTDSRTKVVLPPGADADDPNTITKLHKLFSDATFTNTVRRAVAKSLHEKVTQNLDVQTTITYKTYGRVWTIIMPIFNVEIIDGSIHYLPHVDFQGDDASCMLNAVSTTLPWSTLSQKGWTSILQGCGVMRRIFHINGNE